MAWTAPITFVANSVLTAAQLNTNLRDNLNETAPAKASTPTRIFVTTGANQIAEREIAANTVSASESTVSTSYVDLTTVGPQVTVTTGTAALVQWSAVQYNATAGFRTFMSVAVSGATTESPSDAFALVGITPNTANGPRAGVAHLFTTLTAGSNTFTARYRAAGDTATFVDRRMQVVAL